MAYGKVEETFWHDALVRSLSRDGRDIFLYLLTSPHKNRLGYYVLDPWYACGDLQWEQSVVMASLYELEHAGRVAWDPESRMLFVRRFLKHNKLENLNVVKGAITELRSLPDSPLLSGLLAAATKYRLPHYRPLLQALENRLGNGLANGSANGMPNPEVKVLEPKPWPEPEPEPEPLPEPRPNGGGESEIPDSGDSSGLSGSGQPPPPTPEGSPIERLTAYIGPEHRSAIATVAELAGGASRWAQGVMGLYGPSGTEERLMSGVADAERPSVLATALIRYSTDPKARGAWDGKFFRGFVSKAIRERMADRERGGPDFGDETKRDRDRREVAVARGNQRGAKRRDLEAEKLAAENVELQAWFASLPEERQAAIRADAVARLQVIGRVSRVTQLARDAAMITAMQEARKREKRAPTGAGT